MCIRDRVKGEVGAEFGEIIAGENAAIIFTNGKWKVLEGNMKMNMQ